MSLKNKVAYITGSTKGIGFGIAKQLLKSGMRVIITGRTQEGVDAAVKELSNYKDQVLGVVSDVRNYDDEVHAIEQALEKFGQLDVVIANAGLGIFKSVEDMSISDWNAMIDTNLTGAFYTLKAGVRALKQSKGYYISIASLAGTNFFANGSGYNASKFGLVGFTQAAMLDLRNYDVKVTTIMPGSVSSHFNNHTPSAEDAWKIQPEDIGQLVVDLLKMPANALPSKIEIRPTNPGKK
ncbi:SDR family oxidoreductase [Paucihalobacter ruber]|uniref:SDR family oxidoreductase n=1 Tax=Paucihalobacter ruber TaxID=2567861 RepID=A0A506PGT2_9FLAO|nr:SDR family oxidoreductase [Paucihalobacter ruber]TPV31550.1 SDR family oxidoreductase [Paucihalobacter ruber]